MQLQDLEFYQRVYETGSINLAAKQLGYAQSNVTVRISKLEDEFKTQLFIRNYQGVTPTKDGDKFYHYAVRVITETNELKKNFKKKMTKPKIIISELLFNFLVIDQAEIKLANNDFIIKTSTEIGELSGNVAQFVVTYAQFDNQMYELEKTKNLKASFLVEQKSIRPETPLLVNSDQQCPFRRQTLIRNRSFNRKIVEIDSWNGIIQLVKQGKGIALLPDYLCQKENLVSVLIDGSINILYRIYEKKR